MANRDHEWLYIKKKGRYHRVKPFDGFPTAGLWLVTKHDHVTSHVCIALLKEVDELRIRDLATLFMNFDEACKLVLYYLDEKNRWSVNDFLKDILRVLCKGQISKEKIRDATRLLNIADEYKERKYNKGKRKKK